jgi:alpha-galactosidase
MTTFDQRGLRRLLGAAVAIALSIARPLADQPFIIASHDQAYVGHDVSSRVWTIGSGNFEVAIGFDGSNRLTLQHMWDPQSGREWDIGETPDIAVTLGGQRVPLQTSATLTFQNAAAEETDAGVRLIFTFEHRDQHVLIQRVFACYSGSPTIEVWTALVLENGASPVQVSDLEAWQLEMPSAPVKWVNGLQGQTTDDWGLDSFGVNQREIEDGEEIWLGSDRRSSEQNVPIVFVEDTDAAFFGGTIWSGAWQMAVGRSGDRVTIRTEYQNVSRSLTSARPFEFPHAFFGFTVRSIQSESAALQQFLVQGVRHGRPFQPLVTYNTWYAYGTQLSQSDVVDEMLRASAIGVELFVVDAGWYAGAGAGGRWDFTSGLGSWTVDPDRFPDGLGALSQQAHELGMKFGIWVEPERMALGLGGLPGLADESWLATENGMYGADGNSAQICFGTAAARQWVLDKLSALIDGAQPDYLKWDNNYWVNCNRDGHDHGPGDGPFSHVEGLYGVLGSLRQRYPDLLIENVSGGGNRLDYGMAAFTDAAWMDDRTAPSTVVRHNLEGLMTAFPPGYLLSFLIDNPAEPMQVGAQMPQFTRSRMPGVLGLAYHRSLMNGDLSTQMADEIRNYKSVRDTIGRASGTLLGPQVPAADEAPDGWDVVQEVADDRRTALIFAFKANDDDGRLRVRAQNLSPDVMYEATSMDIGSLGRASGTDLMLDGIELNHSGGSRAHVVALTAK